MQLRAQNALITIEPAAELERVRRRKDNPKGQGKSKSAGSHQRTHHGKWWSYDDDDKENWRPTHPSQSSVDPLGDPWA
eukprot:2340025-Amphidinium_carterae.1